MITSGMNGAVYVIASQSGNLFFSWIIRNNGGNKRKECVIDMSSEITTIEQQQESGFKWVILISNILLLIFVCMGLTTWSVATEHLQEAGEDDRSPRIQESRPYCCADLRRCVIPDPGL